MQRSALSAVSFPTPSRLRQLREGLKKLNLNPGIVFSLEDFDEFVGGYRDL